MGTDLTAEIAALEAQAAATSKNLLNKAEGSSLRSLTSPNKVKVSRTVVERASVDRVKSPRSDKKSVDGKGRTHSAM